MADQENPPSVFEERDSHRTLALEVEGRKFWVPRDTMAIHSPVFKDMLYGVSPDGTRRKKLKIPLPGKKASQAIFIILVNLEVEGRKFWVPRDTMAIHSPVFKAMLYGNFSEANRNAIPLPEKKAKDVEEVLRCLIPSPVCKEIDQSNLETILKFADEYQIEELRRRAESFLASMLEKCQKSDAQLLYILPIAAKWRMQIFKECLDRCVDEFRLGKLLPIFKDVPDQVKTYLALGQVEKGWENSSQNGQCYCQTHRQYYSSNPCTGCGGSAKCPTCHPCNCKAWMNKVKKDLLDSKW